MLQGVQASTTPGRVLAIDWLRGIAVLFMIECHALYLLHPSLDASPAKAFLQLINGLCAPAFLFAAGFALALTNGKAWRSAQEKRDRAWRSLKRIGMVLLASVLLREHFWEALSEHPERLMWPDVLMCIAICLTMIWATLFTLPRWTHALVLAACMIAVLAAAPVLPGRELGFFTPWLNNSRYWDTFPIVPIGSCAFWGALVGLFAARARDRRRAIALGMLASLVAGFALARSGALASYLYGETNTYDLLTMGERAWKVSAATLLLLAIERVYAGKLWWPINVLGTQSLVAYVAHLLLLFGVGPLRVLSPLHQKTGWAGYCIAMPLLVGATLLTCLVVRAIGAWIAERRGAHKRVRQPDETTHSSSAEVNIQRGEAEVQST